LGGDGGIRLNDLQVQSLALTMSAKIHYFLRCCVGIYRKTLIVSDDFGLAVLFRKQLAVGIHPPNIKHELKMGL